MQYAVNRHPESGIRHQEACSSCLRLGILGKLSLTVHYAHTVRRHPPPISILTFTLQTVNIITMKQDVPRRWIAIMVLIAVVLMFSGISAPASAEPLEKAEKACCDECSNGERQGPVPCSTPDCPIFLCLAINVTVPVTLSFSTKSVSIPPVSNKLHPTSPVRPIFHPPAAAIV